MEATNALPAARRPRTPLAVTREHVLSIAEHMFRKYGVQAVGVDAIAQAADVKKMTLYRCFPSKEELVMACMECWTEKFRKRWEQAHDLFPDEPARQLLAFFEIVSKTVSSPDYTGHVIVHLMTDYPDPAHPICVMVREQRAALRAEIRDMLKAAEAADPDQLADTYCLLLDGLLIAARTYGVDSSPTSNACTIAERILRQGCGPRAFPPEPRRFRRW